MILRTVKCSWIKGAADDPSDLCAHGRVEFRIGDEQLIDPEGGLEVTVSAAALYLLRTLEREHTKRSPVGDHLFPCCGFSLFAQSGSQDVLIFGCPNGIDFEVHHGIRRDRVSLHASDGRSWEVEWAEWQRAVFSFVDAVADFFAGAAPKTPSPDDLPGFRTFLEEWHRRRGRPLDGRSS